MASRDITYCSKECENKDCKRNKENIKKLISEEGYRVVTAISWSEIPLCQMEGKII